MEKSSKIPVWGQITLEGLGLLGGSVAAAAKRAGLAERLVGLDRNPEHVRRSLELGQIDRAADNFSNAFQRLDPSDLRPILVVAAVPVNAVAETLAQAVAAVQAVGISRRTVVLTDTASVQSGIFDELKRKVASPWPENVVYHGSHPIAGSEKSGPDAAAAELFAGKIVVLTRSADPSLSETANRDAEAFTLLTDFWRSLGAEVRILPTVEHDRILAETSHLAHLMAAALAATVVPEFFDLSGSGLADTTRLAAGNPDVWVDIMERNRLFLLEAVERLEKTLARWKSALQTDDAAAIKNLLTEAHRRRNALGN